MKCPARFLPNHFRCAHRWAWTAVHVHVLIVPSAMCRALMARSSLRCTTQDGTQTAQGSGKPCSTHWGVLCRNPRNCAGSLRPLRRSLQRAPAQFLRDCVSCDTPRSPSSGTTVTTQRMLSPPCLVNWMRCPVREGGVMHRHLPSTGTAVGVGTVPRHSSTLWRGDAHRSPLHWEQPMQKSGGQQCVYACVS
ncbi:hypothetical protein T484DRAFT_2371957 [Baffinella frigidus]|nr:hypothetical protein T484DRAFT_2371957 [Cryptophyta sp. CCMP2293]